MKSNIANASGSSADINSSNQAANGRKSIDTIKMNLQRNMVSGALLALIVSSAISLLFTIATISNVLRPQLVSVAQQVADQAAREVGTAVSYGIPVDEIPGLEGFLTRTGDQYLELRAIRFIPADQEIDLAAYSSQNSPKVPGLGDDALGWISAQASRGLTAILKAWNHWSASGAPGDQTATSDIVTAQINHQGTQVGTIVAQVEQGYINNQMRDVFFDTFVIILAVMLIAFEVLIVLVAFFVAKPLQSIDQVLDRQANNDFSGVNTVEGMGAVAQFARLRRQETFGLREHATALLSSIRLGISDVTNRANQGIEDGARSLTDLQQRTIGFLSDIKLFTTRTVGGANILDARIPLFLFSFGEELQKSFMPLFVGEYYRAEGELFSREIMLGLPISAFMFVVAAATPFAGRLVDRFGNKRLYFIGLVPAIAGYLLCVIAQSAMDIVIARSVTAVGYAIITISCQGYIAEVLTKEDRARGMAIFVGVLMTATMSGTAIGAILADWLGYKPVFLVSASIAAAAGVVAFLMLRQDKQRTKNNATPSAATTHIKAVDEPRETKGPGFLKRLVSARRYFMIVVLVAIPTKVVLTGFLYVFVPIYLATLGTSQSEIGRIMMMYSLVIIPLSPIASRLADMAPNKIFLVVISSIASGAVLIVFRDAGSAIAVLVAVVLTGIAHSAIKAPLIASVLDAIDHTPSFTKTSALSLLRTSERIGSVLGPIMVGFLMVRFSNSVTMMALGGCVAAAGVIFLLILMIDKPKQVNAQAV